MVLAWEQGWKRAGSVWIGRINSTRCLLKDLLPMEHFCTKRKFKQNQEPQRGDLFVVLAAGPANIAKGIGIHSVWVVRSFRIGKMPRQSCFREPFRTRMAGTHQPRIRARCIYRLKNTHNRREDGIEAMTRYQPVHQLTPKEKRYIKRVLRRDAK